MADTKTLPAVGETVYYFLPVNHRWAEATVIDGLAAEHNNGIPLRYLPPRQGTCHLHVHLNPELDGSASEHGFRLNVAEGTEPGQWQRQPPHGWEAAQQAWMQRKDVQKEVRLQTWAATANQAGNR